MMKKLPSAETGSSWRTDVKHFALHWRYGSLAALEDFIVEQPTDIPMRHWFAYDPDHKQACDL
jgi:hypothetical protein